MVKGIQIACIIYLCMLDRNAFAAKCEESPHSLPPWMAECAVGKKGREESRQLCNKFEFSQRRRHYTYVCVGMAKDAEKESKRTRSFKNKRNQDQLTI